MNDWPIFLICLSLPTCLVPPLTVCARKQFGIYLQGNVECHQQSSCCLPSEVNIVPETQNVNGENFLRCCLTYKSLHAGRNDGMRVCVCGVCVCYEDGKKILNCIIYCFAWRPLREMMSEDSPVITV